jgi:uncharacterized Tic20 family protein
MWAVFAHLSALAMGIGLLIPIVGWSESRRKSSYVSFQCLQALGYQALGYTLWVLITLIVIVVMSLRSLASLINTNHLQDELMSFIAGHVALMFGLISLYFLLPIAATISCALGMDFRYPFMGGRLAGYLNYKYDAPQSESAWLNEEHEERWVAAMGHFAVIIMLWGLLAPSTAWIMQGRRSSFLRFQSIQTIIFQAGLLVLSMGAMVLYLGGAMILIFSIGMSGIQGLDSPGAFAGLGVFLASMLCMIAVMLIVPLFHILGQWAGYRTLKGDQYRYPIVGRVVEGWMAKQIAGHKEQT